MARIVTFWAAATWRTPLALSQALVTRRTVARLPQAVGEQGVITATQGDSAVDGEPVRVLVVGDSLASGVGVDHHRNTLAGTVARLLADRWGRPVAWDVRAHTGFTAGEVIGLLDLKALAGADVVVVSVGGNDAKNMHPAWRWRNELTRLLATITANTRQSTPIILLPVPMLQMCPALPDPLAGVLGERTRHFDEIATDIASRYPRIRRFGRFAPPRDNLFAADGFHPSADFHTIYAECIVDLL